MDIVTDRKADLHADILGRLLLAASPSQTGQLYAAAYRPVQRNGETALDIWHEPLLLSRPLPTLPLGLRGGPCLPLDLETTYERTRREQRLA